MFIFLTIIYDFIISIFRKNKPSEILLYNIKNIPLFIPWKYASSALLQTFINYFSWTYLKKHIKYDYSKIITLKDGAIINLDYLIKNKKEEVIILMPGLNGCKNGHYIQQFLQYISIPFGYNTIIYNKRGLNKSKGTFLKPFARYAEVNDFIEVLENIKIKYKKIILVSFSVSGPLLVKVLSKRPDLINYGITIANLFDANICIKTMPKIYNQTLIYPSVEYFDSNYILPYHNYETLEDYYIEQSCYKELQNVTKPLYCINAMDDLLGIPHVNLHSINASKKNNNVKVIITTHGGHLGWVTSFYKSWLFEKCLPIIFEQIVQ
jgi:predicted alpha/beta-fold hydrolase